MATLIRSLNSTTLAARQIVVFTIAFLVAETYYKFGSFTLELFAFLATWTALDGLALLTDRLRTRGGDDA